ncbi:MAG: aminotransferase class V-fold PLP-dependent enzyme [Candidatus Geothermarchaeales archaeon]
MLDVEKIREDFPILRSDVIYLDSAASSLTPEPVINKMLDFYHRYRSNTERGIYGLAQEASEEFDKAREKIAEFIGAKPSEIIFVKNTTEGLNLVAHGLKWERGDKVVTTRLEHHSNYIVWLREKVRHGLQITSIEPDEEGILNLSAFEDAVDDETRVVAVTHVSNVLGTVNPVEDIAKIAHEHGAYLVVDGAQSVPHTSIDVKDLDLDFLVFSGHKMCGPTGIGAIYVREEILDALEPLCIGGGSIETVDVDGYKLRKGPARFEAGTPAIAEVIGVGAAVEYLRGVGMKRIEEHERTLTEKMYDELRNLPGVEVYGPPPSKRLGIVAFNVLDLNPHDVALALDVFMRICVRSGHHCAEPLTRVFLGCPHGTARASVYLYNVEGEIDALVSGLKQVIDSRA